MQGDVIELGQTHESTTIETEARGMPVHRPVADERDIARAAAILTGARRVAIVAGDGPPCPRPARKSSPWRRRWRHRWRRPRGTGPHSDDPSPLGWGRGQLFSAAGQPHRAQRRPGAAHRLRYRRPGHAELADSADPHTDRADRGRSARNRAQLPEHDGTGRRSGRPWRAWGTSSAA